MGWKTGGPMDTREEAYTFALSSPMTPSNSPLVPAEMQYRGHARFFPGSARAPAPDGRSVRADYLPWKRSPAVFCSWM